MRKIALPGNTGILVLEKIDYPLTIKKLERAHLRLKTGMGVWKRQDNKVGFAGEREMLIDFGNGGPCMFESRDTLISMMRHYNNIWRCSNGAWPPDSSE